MIFFFQAEDGIRDLVRSRGLGDVYKRQGYRGALGRNVNAHIECVRHLALSLVSWIYSALRDRLPLTSWIRGLGHWIRFRVGLSFTGGALSLQHSQRCQGDKRALRQGRLRLPILPSEPAFNI